MQVPRILVVEDEAIVAIDLQCQLRKLGYDVPDPVSSGDRALLTIEESRPDLVLMDINIEGELDGIATASRIPADYRIPVIYLTAHSDASVVSRASETRPFGYLLKPYSERELHALIQVSLARAMAERQASPPASMFVPPSELFPDLAAPDRATPNPAAPNPAAPNLAARVSVGLEHFRARGAIEAFEVGVVSWRKSGGTLFAAARSAEGSISHRLIVERLPSRNGWDWAVWRPGDASDMSRHGRANSAVTAMTAAEQAARCWTRDDD
jgi:CheY-like chemotaxis protein